MALAVKFHGRGISSLSSDSIEAAISFFEKIKPTETEQKIGRDIFREIMDRLNFLNDVGVGYLSLDRSAASLSGEKVSVLDLLHSLVQVCRVCCMYLMSHQ